MGKKEDYNVLLYVSEKEVEGIGLNRWFKSHTKRCFLYLFSGVAILIPVLVFVELDDSTRLVRYSVGIPVAFLSSFFFSYPIYRAWREGKKFLKSIKGPSVPESMLGVGPFDEVG